MTKLLKEIKMKIKSKKLQINMTKVHNQIKKLKLK